MTEIIKEAPMPNPTVKQIVEVYLKQFGYDGLYYDNVCSCKLGELMECGAGGEDCRAGYRRPSQSVCAHADGEEHFHIGPEKP